MSEEVSERIKDFFFTVIQNILVSHKETPSSLSLHFEEVFNYFPSFECV